MAIPSCLVVNLRGCIPAIVSTHYNLHIEMFIVLSVDGTSLILWTEKLMTSRSLFIIFTSFQGQICFNLSGMSLSYQHWSFYIYIKLLKLGSINIKNGGFAIKPFWIIGEVLSDLILCTEPWNGTSYVSKAWYRCQDSWELKGRSLYSAVYGLFRMPHMGRINQRSPFNDALKLLYNNINSIKHS